ncbi:choline ABC transporter permease subunit [Rhodospirillaceae bacterium SYSU D60014]|uniref:choline ABC transporter permease subunit n=1 Tax=Virgifigura deserti TaxID=2268457 RepID=UPI000E675A4B
MEWLNEFLTDNKIPLGKWVEAFVGWITDNFDWLFDAISEGLGFLIEALVDLLAATPPLALILLLCVFGYWLHRSWRLVALIGLGLLLILNLGFWEEMTETLALVLFATAISIAIGVPIGIYAARRPWFYAGLRPVLDMMQTIPTFVYLIPTLILFGLGMVPGLISTVIFAIPAPIRLTYLGIIGVPKPLVEAGESFGATRWQLLYKVELPHAMPTIMAGITQCIMLSLSMVVIAALVGADGLGKPVVRALNSVNIAQGFEAGLAIVIVAIILDRVLKQVEPTGDAKER